MTERDLLKCVEELNELSTILLQQYNKPHRDLKDEIIEELGDVKWRLQKVIDHYGKKEVNRRVEFKKTKNLLNKFNPQ
tara:strand:- start:149 stop:382 length:234 start_codon:yes stop_codon:yes gene_type:complete